MKSKSIRLASLGREFDQAKFILYLKEEVFFRRLIKITSDQLAEDPVIVIGLEKYPFQIAQNFTNFIELYLAGDPRLYEKIIEEKTDN